MMRYALMMLWCAGMFSGASAADTPQPGGDFPQFTENGVWTWYGEPKAVYYKGDHEKTYLGWISCNGDVRIASYDHGSGDIRVEKVGSQSRDDHCAPSVIVRPDGRIMAFWSGHNGPVRCRISSNPEDISSWESEQAAEPGSACYPNVIQLSDEDDRIYLFYRNGGWYADATFRTSLNGRDWSDARSWMTGIAGGYVKYGSNGRDEIHFIAEQKHRSDAGDMYYACFRGGSFYRSDGTEIRSLSDGPLKASEAEVVYRHDDDGDHATGWDMAVDGDNRPVFVYAKGVQSSNGHEYWYLRWNGSQWVRNKITDAGSHLEGGEGGFSGGVTLDHADPSVVYLSRDNGSSSSGKHEIERWETADGGRNWSSRPITENSSTMNYRPIVPRGYTGGDVGLVWLHGAYHGYTGCPKTIAVKYWNPAATAISGVGVLPASETRLQSPLPHLGIAGVHGAVSGGASRERYLPTGRRLSNARTTPGPTRVIVNAKQ